MNNADRVIGPAARRTWRDDAPWDLAVAVATGVLYGRTLLPGLGYSGDTAIFQLIGSVVGLPHGPGYPLYVALNSIWVRVIPFGSFAFRANLLSAVLGALACVAVAKLLRAVGTGPAAASAGAVAFGFTATFWSQAIVAEVYTLHALLVALVLGAFVAWANAPRRRGLLLCAVALYALSFGNHLTTLTLLPALGFLILRTDRRVVSEPRTVAAVAAVTGLAALQYLLVVWRAADPSTAYLGGDVHDLPSFLDYVTGGNFRGRMFAFSAVDMLTGRVSLLAGYLAGTFGPLLALLPLGWIRIRRHAPRGTNGLLLLAAAGNALFAIGYDIGDLEPLFIPTDLVIAVWLGAGLGEILERLTSSPRLLRGALALAVPAALVVANLPATTRRHDTGIAEALDRTLPRLPPGGAVILTPNYPMSAFLWYELIAAGWQERGIYLMPHTVGEGGRDLAAFVRRYAVEQRTYRIDEQRLEVPPGLPVLCFCSMEQRVKLSRGGFQLRPYLPDLWLLVPTVVDRADGAARPAVEPEVTVP